MSVTLLGCLVYPMHLRGSCLRERVGAALCCGQPGLPAGGRLAGPLTHLLQRSPGLWQGEPLPLAVAGAEPQAPAFSAVAACCWSPLAGGCSHPEPPKMRSARNCAACQQEFLGKCMKTCRCSEKKQAIGIQNCLIK